MFLFAGLILVFIFLIVFVPKPKKHRIFTPETKKRVLNRKNHRYKICGTHPNHWDFDHIGSRADNSAKNCQAFCLDCHRDQTTREARQSKER